MSITVITPPAVFITVAEAKAQLRVDHVGDDTLIEALVASVCASIDGPQGRLGWAFGEQTIDCRFDALSRTGYLPCPPLIEIVSVQVGATDLDQTAFAVGLDGRFCLLQRGAWGQAVVRYRAGYPNIPAVGDTPAKSTVPAPVRQAALMIVARLYAQRGEMIAGSMTSDPMAESLLAPYRVMRIG